MADMFWPGRSHDPWREGFLEGLLHIAEYLLDKTIDEGKVILRKTDNFAVHIQVPFGPKMRETIFEQPKFINAKYRMAGFELGGIPAIADIYTDIRIFLPKTVRETMSFGNAGGQKMSLERFRDTVMWGIQDHKEKLEYDRTHKPTSFFDRRVYFEDE